MPKQKRLSPIEQLLMEEKKAFRVVPFYSDTLVRLLKACNFAVDCEVKLPTTISA